MACRRIPLRVIKGGLTLSPMKKLDLLLQVAIKMRDRCAYTAFRRAKTSEAIAFFSGMAAGFEWMYGTMTNPDLKALETLLEADEKQDLDFSELERKFKLVKKGGGLH